MIWQLVSYGTVALCCGAALVWGGRDERMTAIGFILAVIASRIVSDGAYEHTEIGVAVIDVLVFFGLLVLALYSDRFWPMWAAAFQLVGTLVHGASSAQQTGDFAWAYFIALLFWSYPVFIALAAGTWFEGRFRNARNA